MGGGQVWLSEESDRDLSPGEEIVRSELTTCLLLAHHLLDYFKISRLEDEETKLWSCVLSLKLGRRRRRRRRKCGGEIYYHCKSVSDGEY